MGFSFGGGLGPFRASVSTRGMRAGISTGVGPLRYNKTLMSTRRSRPLGTTYSVYQQPGPQITQLPRRPDYSAQLPTGSQLPMTTGSQAVAKLKGQNELTTLLNQAANHRSGALLCSLPLYALTFTLLFVAHPAWSLLPLIAAIVVGNWLHNRAIPYRRVIVSYALPSDGFATPEQLAAVQRHVELTRLWPTLLRSQALWRRTRSGRVQNPYQQKINSGASHISERADVIAGYERPRHLVLDEQVATPSLRCDTQSLFFLPDRVLVYDSTTKLYASTDYSQLKVSIGVTDYAEDEKLTSRPSDSKRVATTWLRANKNGGPDRRYAHNYAIPVMRYDTLDLTCTQTGLRWELIISRAGTAQTIGSALTAE